MFINILTIKQEIVLGHSGYLNANIIRSAFIGQHIGYDIENCQKVK
jgi:hypothetical protein